MENTPMIVITFLLTVSVWIMGSLIIYDSTFNRFYGDVLIFGVRFNQAEGVFLVLLWPIIPVFGLVYFVSKIIRGN